jgi:hypothetical protein
MRLCKISCSGKAINISYSVCVRSLSYPLFNVNSPITFQMWFVWFDRIFSHYLVNNKIFENKFLDINCVFVFSLIFLNCFFKKN